MTNTAIDNESGKLSAIAVYVLYLLSIPSAAVLALVGVIVAYATRDGASPLARAHLEEAIRIWWVAVWWAVAGIVLIGIGLLLTVVLVGFPIMWIGGLVAFIGFIWFTVKSLLQLLKLLDGRTP
ncbi:MAG: hypothetical protein NW206_07155 [Hyphomonadaceae bacterium]|nr:hypothetical protein [Hyphomonadaceae bacterium]